MRLEDNEEEEETFEALSEHGAECRVPYYMVLGWDTLDDSQSRILLKDMSTVLIDREGLPLLRERINKCMHRWGPDDESL